MRSLRLPLLALVVLLTSAPTYARETPGTTTPTATQERPVRNALGLLGVAAGLLGFGLLVDNRSKAKVYKNGSSKIDVGLTEEQAQEAFGDEDATGGWYRIAFMAGGNVGRDTNRQRIQDESGKTIGSSGSNDDFVITNTTQQTDAGTLRLLEWLETNEAPVRYILPTATAGIAQIHYHPAMTKDEGADQISTQVGVRQLQFTLRGDKERRFYDDVSETVQTAWPTELAGAKDTAFPGS